MPALFQHIFEEHLLPQLHSTAQIKPGYIMIWPSVFLLMCLSILVVVKVTAFPKAVKLMQACFSLQAWRQLEREESNPFKTHSVLLSVFFYLNLSFFLYKVNDMYQLILTDRPHLWQFAFIALATFSVTAIKGVANKLLSVFTDDGKIIPEYVYSNFVVSQAFGLLLFPVLVLAEFSTINQSLFLTIALVVLISAQLYRWYRGVLFGIVEHRIGLLQTIVYFCALEIIPVLILAKFLIEKF